MKANTASLAAKRDGLFARSQPGVIITDGVSTSIDDSLLTSYFDAAGGTLELINENTELLQIPTDTGLREFQSGNLCNGEKAKLRVLHYRVETLTKPWSVYPQILWKYFDYVLTNNYHQILSENCLIFIFDSEEVLRKPWPLCASHEAALASGELTWGK
ncbi:MAG: hypothetical protein Q8Q67_01190 [bacterium]|nr:hypothetical protein [bacterium]